MGRHRNLRVSVAGGGISQGFEKRYARDGSAVENSRASGSDDGIDVGHRRAAAATEDHGER